MRKSHNSISVLIVLLVVSCSSTTERIIDSYPNGKPKVVSVYEGRQNDQTKVREIHYYASGQKECEYTFQNGMRNGAYRCWFENGNTSINGKYIDNLLEGEVLFYYDTTATIIRARRLFKNNDLTHEVLYYKNGNPLDESFYDNGKQVGRWTVWHSNGQKEIETSDCWNGIQTEWFSNGVKSREGLLQNSLRSGWWNNWDSLGNPAPRTLYRNDSIIEIEKPNLNRKVE